MSSFNELINNPLYKHLIELLDEKEKREIEESVKKLLGEVDEKINLIQKQNEEKK